MNGTRRNATLIRLMAMALLAVEHHASWSQDPEGPVPNYAQMILEGKTPKASTIKRTSGDEVAPAPMITQPIAEPAGCTMGTCPPRCNTDHCLPGRKCPGRCGSGSCSSCGSGCGSCSSGFKLGCDDGCGGRFSNLCNNLFTCFCCPDPCYESEWLPQANAAFFVDHARPQSHMRIRWDAGLDMIMPDRNEFYWARIGRKGPRNREDTLNYHEMTMYTETAAGAAGVFVEMPYRLLETDNNGFDAGWGDLSIGTKSMFIDCELMQMTFQFKTIIPVGSTPKGFGTGHVTLEPSILTAVKLTPCTWCESQISEWIPIGGDNDFAGMILHYGTSVNRLWCQKKAVQFVTSLEYKGYVFQDGALTNPAGFVGPETQKSSRDSYHYLGSGCRFVICDRYDIGFGAAFSLTDDHWAKQLYRTEVRIRY